MASLSTKQWGFATGAFTGIMAASALWLGFVSSPSITAILVLCPTSVLAFAYQGGSFWMSAFLFFVELGGNIFIYGLIGILIASAIELLTPKRISN